MTREPITPSETSPSETPPDTSVDTSESDASSASSSYAKPSEAPQPIPENHSAKDTPGFVKLAMRNMVKKGGKSLFHFSLSALGLLAVLVGLAYLTR